MKMKTVWFILGGIASFVLYLLGIGIYTRVSKDPIIFFASMIMGIIAVAVVCFGIGMLKKKLFDRFTILMMSLVYFLGIVVLAVFGPTFIDRSISYHLAFYAVEENVVYVDAIEEEFSSAIFEKRVHDAVETGFLTLNDDGSMSPTLKAKLMYYVLRPLGELTGSMDTYYAMKEEVQFNSD